MISVEPAEEEDDEHEDYLYDQIKRHLTTLEQHGDLDEWYLPEVNDQTLEIPVELTLFNHQKRNQSEPTSVQATLSIVRSNEYPTDQDNDTICILVSGEQDCIDPMLLFPNDDQLWRNLLNAMLQYETYLNK